MSLHVLTKRRDVGLGLINPPFQPLSKPWVARGVPAERRRLDARLGAELVYLAENVMMRFHVPDSANRHTGSQVPNDLLSGAPNVTHCGVMGSDFRQALLWHMDRHATSIAELVAATGVSRDVINKLKAREGSSTTAENAMAIAAFYGKSVNDFVQRRPSTPDGRIAALLDLLEPGERQLLEQQIQGILSGRGRK